jgi:hypothetical protein
MSEKILTLDGVLANGKSLECTLYKLESPFNTYHLEEAKKKGMEGFDEVAIIVPVNPEDTGDTCLVIAVTRVEDGTIIEPISAINFAAFDSLVEIVSMARGLFEILHKDEREKLGRAALEETHRKRAERLR